MRRVVVTGMGIVCPLGLGVEHVWRRLVNAKSGISAPCRPSPITTSRARSPARCPPEPGPMASSTSASGSPSKTRKKMDRFVHMAMVAGTEAVEDSGWVPQTEDDHCATGVMIGSGIGGLETIYDGSLLVSQGKARRLSPFFIPSALINLASGHLSIKYGFKGPNHAVVTACASGVHAMGDAARLIMWGDADVMVAGGAEAGVCEIGIAGFLRLARAVHRLQRSAPGRRPAPGTRTATASSWAKAPACWCGEYEHALRQRAKIYAEIGGYGMSGDAYHITAPAEGHDGAFRSMRNAMKNGGVAPRTSIRQRARHLHAAGRRSGTGSGGAVVRRCRQGLAMSSTKSSTGHLLGAAGAIEAIFSILANRDNVAPPT